MSNVNEDKYQANNESLDEKAVPSGCSSAAVDDCIAWVGEKRPRDEALPLAEVSMDLHKAVAAFNNPRTMATAKRSRLMKVDALSPISEIANVFRNASLETPTIGKFLSYHLLLSHYQKGYVNMTVHCKRCKYVLYCVFLTFFLTFCVNDFNGYIVSFVFSY